MEGIRVGNAQFIRDLNLGGIFKAIYQLRSVSRKDLAHATGYSPATISNHVRTLIDEGFVIETKKGTSTGGRRPIHLTVNPKRGYFFSVDIKINKVILALFNLTIELAQKRVISFTKSDGPGYVLNLIFQELDQMIRENHLSKEEIMGIGVALPGQVDQEKGVLEFAPNLGWSQVPINQPFMDHLGLLTILENEATAAVIGESQFIYPQVETMVYVSVNEGIGCGIIFSHQVYRGASGNAGEFGHIIVASNGPYCHCGNHGCWEALASENFIMKRAKEEGLLREKETKEDLYQKEKSRDLLLIFQEAGRNLGVGMANIVNSLSPQLLVIGGDITQIKSSINKDMMMTLKEKALPGLFKSVNVRFSELNSFASVYGLASLVFEKSIDFSH